MSCCDSTVRENKVIRKSSIGLNHNILTISYTISHTISHAIYRILFCHLPDRLQNPPTIFPKQPYTHTLHMICKKDPTRTLKFISYVLMYPALVKSGSLLPSTWNPSLNPPELSNRGSGLVTSAAGFHTGAFWAPWLVQPWSQLLCEYPERRPCTD